MGKPTLEFEQVDISNFDARKEQVSAQLANAAKSIGFFYITGTSCSLLHRTRKQESLADF